MAHFTEKRMDKKGRPYLFIRSHPDDENVWTSITVFPHPNNDGWAAYIWWGVAFLTPEGVTRNRWMTRHYIHDGWLRTSKGNYHPLWLTPFVNQELRVHHMNQAWVPEFRVPFSDEDENELF